MARSSAHVYFQAQYCRILCPLISVRLILERPFVQEASDFVQSMSTCGPGD